LAKSTAPERYEDIIQRLDAVVKQLESGDLSLEESLKAFEENVVLVRKGEHKLTEAEQRVEILLNEADNKRAPFDASSPREAAAPTAERRPLKPTAGADDDLPL
jgi:exodeoxyribonuclease VII small subunit